MPDPATPTQTADETRNGIKSRFTCKHIGIIFGVCGSLMYSFNLIFAKFLTIPAFQIALHRNSLQYVILIPILLHRENVSEIIGPRESRISLWMCGLSGSLWGLFTYSAVLHLSPGNAASLMFLDIVVVPIFGRIFYKMSFTFFDALFSFVAFCGVVLIAQPSFLFPNSSSGVSEDSIGILYALLGVLCASFTYLELRKIGKDVSFLVSTLCCSMVGLVLNVILMLCTGQYELPCSSELVYIVLTTMCGFLGQCTFTLSIQRERPGTVTVLMSLQIIFVYVFQVVLLDDIPSTLSLIGSGLIFSTSVCIGIRKVVSEKRRRQSIAKDSLR